MSDAERDPQVLVSARIADHEKLIHLPSDAARWGWIVVLGRAKLRRPAGVFPSRSVLAHDLGRYARFVDDYLRVGLLEDHDGAMVVHDWSKHQERRVDPTAAERQRRHREITSPVTLRPGDPRGRASALSPSLSQSQETSQRNGTAVPAREPEDPALDFLAAIGAHVAPDGNGIHRKLVDLVRRRGSDVVLAALGELYEADPHASGRQLVFAAENALDRPPTPDKPAARQGYHAQGDPTLAFRSR